MYSNYILAASLEVYLAILEGFQRLLIENAITRSLLDYNNLFPEANQLAF